MGWQGACTLPLQKGKSAKYESKLNEVLVSWVHVVAKLYGSVLFKDFGMKVNVQHRWSNVILLEVGFVWTKCFLHAGVYTCG